MSVLVGRLVSGPKMLEIVDLRVGSTEDAHQWYSDLISTFGIERVAPSSFLFPPLLSPEELRELNLAAGQKLGLKLE